MLHIPAMRGVIDRRILVNYRADPDVLARVLPAPFRPKLIGGAGIVGICLIRLRNIRPRGVPGGLGFCSENAAHRIAVEWERDGQSAEGVYIPRRDTSSQLSVLLGGRLFPGVHQHARFAVAERGDTFDVRLESDDRQTRVHVVGHITATLPAQSAFASLEAASNFFERGSLGYSASADPQCFDGLELRTWGWQVRPLAIRYLESSFFEDRRLFPAGTIQFDSALIMQGVAHEWRAHKPLVW